MTRYGSIYVVTNTATGEQYVGQTRQKALRRWKCHINTANSKVAAKYKLAKAIQHYGPHSFEFLEVFTAFDADILNNAEIAWIQELHPEYNITKGGAGHRGVKASESVRQGRSARLKEKWSNSEWRSEQIAKIKVLASTAEAKARGRVVAALGSAARAKKVFCQETQQIFESTAEAARQLGLSHTGIRYAIAHKIKVHCAYTLQRVES
jgi:group I intron endonuclease